MFINGVLICLAITVISYFFWNCSRNVCFIRRLNTLPGPKTLPFIGISHLLLRHEFLDIVLKMAEDYSSPFQLWLGSMLVIVIYEPDTAKTVLRSRNCIDKSILYKFISPLFGMGLIAAPASVWTRIRTMTAPTFSSHMLRNFFNIFVEQSVIFTHKLDKDSLKGNEIILLEGISNCTWRMACDSMMGMKLEPNKDNQYVKAIQRLKKVVLCRISNVLLSFDVIYNLTALGRKQKKDVNLIRSLVDEMIQQRIHELDNPNTIKDENNQTHTTFFDIMMETSRKENFTREEIRDNVLTMLVSASDTITVTTNFVVFMLANFPKIQEKVYEELLEIYGMKTVKSVPIEHNDLQCMHYLDRVIKETIRLFPPVPLIGRRVTEDLNIGKITLPKGANVIIGILKMHRDEKYWPNPLMFDPDRFLPENINNCQSYCYMPFSDGPRNCIGMKYAMSCMKVILATLVRTFVFKVNESIEISEIKVKFDTLISTDKPLKVKIEKRYFQ